MQKQPAGCSSGLLRGSLGLWRGGLSATTHTVRRYTAAFIVGVTGKNRGQAEGSSEPLLSVHVGSGDPVVDD